METKQYCIKKTPNEAQKEMEELTRREIIKLTEKISQNPDVLRPKFIEDSDDDSYDDSDSDDTSLESSVSDSDSDNENSALVIYKKEQEIDKLSERNYYKSLEMSNLIVENGKLKDELMKMQAQNNNNNRIIESFRKLFEYKNTMKINPFIIAEGYSIKEITSSLVEVQTDFVLNKKRLTELENEVNSFEDIFKQYFVSEIRSLSENITKQHDNNHEIMNKYINNVTEKKAKEISDENNTTVVVGMVLFFGLGVICNYFFK
jgi:hypothetical protein